MPARYGTSLPSLRQLLRWHAAQPELSPEAPLLSRLERGSGHFNGTETLLMVLTGTKELALMPPPIGRSVTKKNGEIAWTDLPEKRGRRERAILRHVPPDQHDTYVLSKSDPGYVFVFPEDWVLKEAEARKLPYLEHTLPPCYGPQRGPTRIYHVPTPEAKRVAQYLTDQYSWAPGVEWLQGPQGRDWNMHSQCFQGLAYGYHPWWIAHWVLVHGRSHGDHTDMRTRYAGVREALLDAEGLYLRVRRGHARWAAPLPS